MAIKTTGPITPVAKSSGKGEKSATAFESRFQALMEKTRVAEHHLEEFNKEGSRSSISLKKFNKSISVADLAAKTFTKALADSSSKVFGGGRIPAEVIRGIEKYKDFGKNLEATFKGLDNLLKGISQGTRAANKFYDRGISKVGKGVTQAAEAYNKFYDRGVSRVTGGVNFAASQQPFQLKGKGVAEAFNSKFAKDQLRDQRSFSQQANMYSARGPGMYEALYERSNPSPRLGKRYSYNKNFIPAMMGGMMGGGIGGDGGGIGGLPRPIGGLPAINNLPARLYTNPDWTRGSSGPFKSRYDWGISDAEVVNAPSVKQFQGLTGPPSNRFDKLLNAAAEIGVPYAASRFIINQFKKGNETQQEAFRASRFGAASGESFSGSGMRDFLLGHSGGTFDPRNKLLNLFSSSGIAPEEAIAMTRSYSLGGKGRDNAYRASALAKMSPELGFVDTPEMMGRLEGFRTMGYGTDHVGQLNGLAGAVSAGVEHGMPKVQSLKNMDDALQVLARGMGGRMPGMGGLAGRVEAWSSSSIPSLRTGAGIQAGLSSIMSSNEGIVNNPYLFTLMAQSMLGPGGKANVGTFASGINRMAGKGIGTAWAKGLNPHVRSELNRPGTTSANKLAFLFENNLLSPTVELDMLRHQFRSMGIPDLMSDRAVGAIMGSGSRALALHEFGFGGTGDFVGGGGMTGGPTRIRGRKGVSALRGELPLGVHGPGIGPGITGGEEAFAKDDELMFALNKSMVEMSRAETSVSTAINGAFANGVSKLGNGLSSLGDKIDNLGAVMSNLFFGTPTSYHPGPGFGTGNVTSTGVHMRKKGEAPISV